MVEDVLLITSLDDRAKSVPGSSDETLANCLHINIREIATQLFWSGIGTLGIGESCTKNPNVLNSPLRFLDEDGL